MKKKNPIREQSYAFALEIVNFCQEMIQRKEYVLSKQLLKSGTSIGANVEEVIQGQSKPDFIAKLSISLKEAHETFYWLRLIEDSGFDPLKKTPQLRTQLDSIISLLTAIIKSSKRSIST